MKVFAFLLALLAGVGFTSVLAQGVPVPKSQKTDVKPQAQPNQDSLYQRTWTIPELYDTINKTIGTGLATKSLQKFDLMLGMDAPEATVIAITVPKSDDLRILGLERYPYYRVQYKSNIGYVQSWCLNLSITKLDKLDTDLWVALKTRSSSAASLPAAIPVPEYDSRPSDKTIHTGPRGGRFHYSESGKKVYEKKN